MLTPEHGLVAAYVRGARGRRMRPVLIPGNQVSTQLRSRNDSQLPQATVELVRSRAAILAEPLAAAALEWTTALMTAVLPERQPYPAVFQATDGFMEALEVAPSAIGWAPGLVRLELLLVAALGYGRSVAELPEPLRQRNAADWPQLLEALTQTGELLDRELLAGRPGTIADTRARLMARLKRAHA